MTFVDLLALTDQECEAFIREDVADYATQLQRDEALSAEAATARARDVLGPTLRQEHAMAAELGHRRLTAIDVSGTTVGWLWVTSPDDDIAATSAFLYQITVKPDRRRHGYALAMLAAVERMLADDGIVELRLNVFDANQPARQLYGRAGYELVQQLDGKRHLRKRLPPQLPRQP